MRLFRRGTGGAEKMLRLFTSHLTAKGFDLKVFDEKQIKKHLGKGMYEIWEESLETLRYRKIIMIFEQKGLRVSRLSDNYPDRLVVNMARLPNKEALSKTEKELLGFLAAEEKVS